MMYPRRWRRKARFLLVPTGLLLLALGSLALAQGVGPYITWWTVDGGGGISAGDTYAVSGTAGQPEAGALSSDGRYTVTGGYWGAAAAPVEPPPPPPPPPADGHDLFLPLLWRS